MDVKVCFLTTGFPRYQGDVFGVFVYRLAKYLVREGTAVSVVAPDEADTPPEQVFDGVPVKRFRYFFPRKLQRVAYGWGIPENLRRNPLIALQLPFFMLSFFRAALKAARKCDLIHAHWIPSGLAALPVSRLTGKPFVVTVRATEPARRMIPGPVARIVLKNADSVITPSLEIQKTLRRFDVRANVIPNPVEEDKFHPGIDASSVKSEFNLRESDPVVTFVGRFSDFKDPVTFMSAITPVLEKRPDVKFFLVGDGPLRSGLEEEISRSNLQGCVHLTGMRGDINKILAVSDIFTAISPFENVWSNTIAEAMLMLVPCIISNVGCTRDVFTHEKNCYIVPSRDPKALAAAMLRLLDEPSLRNKLAREATLLLEEHGRSNPRIITACLEIYKEAVGGRD